MSWVGVRTSQAIASWSSSISSSSCWPSMSSLKRVRVKVGVGVRVRVRVRVLKEVDDSSTFAYICCYLVITAQPGRVE